MPCDNTSMKDLSGQPPPTTEDSPGDSPGRSPYRFYVIGLQFTITVLAGVWGGWYLDQRGSGNGLWILGGVVFGMVVAIYHLMRDVRRLQ
ncbi:MAG: AtpZ/AtpI family protein [Planctomycetota bacterium]|nr:AtpZ/AtpI family protein [Planctomycetota bacterium]